MLLFFRRDWAEGAGPAVELASPPVFAASLVAPPSVGAGWVVEVDVDGCPAVVEGFAPPPRLKRLGALLAAVVAPDAAGAELPPPMPEKRDGAGAVVVVVPFPAVVAVAPLVAAVLPGVEAAGLPMLNNVLPPAVVLVPDPAAENKLGVGAPEDVVAPVFPPKLKDAMFEAGCDVAGGAGVVPKLKVGALLAGVEEGVALP
tara:strand:+ start:17418 stop:18020 length:603 start_codon:yes stop_codon:yes gene_type:complete